MKTEKLVKIFMLVFSSFILACIISLTIYSESHAKNGVVRYTYESNGYYWMVIDFDDGTTGIRQTNYHMATYNYTPGTRVRF